MFDNFDDFSDMFSKVWNQFNRPVLDQKPFKAIQVEKGFLIVVNTLGIDKKDLKVTLDTEKGRPYPILKIVGETNLEKIDFKNSVNIGVTLKIDSKIIGISYKCENGLTTILVETEQPKQAKPISAKLIEDDDSLDW